MNKILHWMYHCLLQPNDSFETRLRKQLIATQPLLAIANLIFGVITLVYTKLKDDGEFHRHAVPTGAAASILVSIIAALCWVWVRRTKKSPDLLMLLALSGWLLGFVVVLLSHPTFSLHIMFLTCIMICVVANVYPLKIGIVCTLLSIVNSYNMIIVDKVDEWPLVGFEQFEETVSRRIMTEIVITFVSGIAVVVVYVQRRAYENNLARTTSAVFAARQVAQHLVKFETRLAWRQLLRYKRDAATYDEDLGRAFFQIVQNMEMYRPFLPHYLASSASASSSSHNTNSTKFDISGRGTVRSKSSVHNNNNNHMDGVNCGGGSGITSEDDGLVTLVRQGNSAISINAPDSPIITSDQTNPVDLSELWRAVTERVDSANSNSDASSCFQDGDSAVMSSVGSEGSSYAFEYSSIVGRVMANAGAATVQISLCLLHYKHTMPTNFDAPQALQLLSSFTDRVHEVAEATTATVHGFFGDTAQLSWNTIRRVTRPETRACVFLSRCFSETMCFGAVASGEARSMFCGQKVVVPLIHASWQSAPAIMLRQFSVPMKMCVCDGTTAKAMDSRIGACCFDAFVDRASTPPTTHHVYELSFDEVGLSQSRSNNSSRLNTTSIMLRDDVATMTRHAVDHAMAGNLSEALDALADAMDRIDVTPNDLLLQTHFPESTAASSCSEVRLNVVNSNTNSNKALRSVNTNNNSVFLRQSVSASEDDADARRFSTSVFDGADVRQIPFARSLRYLYNKLNQCREQPDMKRFTESL